MRRLLIIGAGGFGREVLTWAVAQQELDTSWKLGGFLDSNPIALSGLESQFQIIGDPATYSPLPTDCFVCAIGDSAIRLQICADLQRRNALFVSLLHPTSIIDSTSQLGEGSIVCPGAIVSTNVKIGRFVVLNMQSTIGHDAVLGDGCTISCHADITGGAVLGKGVLVGSHGSVLPRVKVGDFGVVGAGSVAFRDVPGRTTVIGVPARSLRWPDHSKRGAM